jgi:hypothetical protein
VIRIHLRLSECPAIVAIVPNIAGQGFKMYAQQASDLRDPFSTVLWLSI